MSVLHGNVLESLRRVQQFSEVDVTEFEIVSDDDERTESTDFYQFLMVHRAVSYTCYVSPETATSLPTICGILGVKTDAALVIVDSGATATVGSPEALQSVLSAIQRVMAHAKVEIDVEAGRAMSFKLADGTTTCAYSRVWMQTPHGWFSTSVIEPTGVPIMSSIKGLRALQSTIDFATNTLSYCCVNCSDEELAIERRLVTSLKGHLLWDPSDAKTGRQF